MAELQAAVHAVLGSLDRSLADTGLGAAELNLLAAFGASRSESLTALTGRTGQRRSTLTGVLDRLERRGLARRTIDPADRRALVIELTAAGADAAGRVATATGAIDRAAHSALTAADVDAFERVLAALVGASGD